MVPASHLIFLYGGGDGDGGGSSSENIPSSSSSEIPVSEGVLRLNDLEQGRKEIWMI